MNNALYDVNAERSLIGSVIIKPELYFELSRLISCDDFSDLNNRELWRAIGECVEGGHFDLVVLEAALRRRGSLDSIGGIKEIVAIANETPTFEGAQRYAEIVSDLGERRRKLKALNTAMSQLSDLKYDVSSADSFVQNVVLAPTGRSKTADFRQAFEQFKTDYDSRRKSGTYMSGIESGYTDLDIMLGGFEKGRMYVIGGRPSMGKSAYALNIASKMAEKRKTVMYFSLEMQASEIVKRVCGIGTGVKIRRMKHCRLSAAEEQKISDYQKRIGDYFIINDSGYQTMQTITTECLGKASELAARGRRLECVMIDHLQLISSSGKNLDRRNQIGEASRRCKILADELQCPVIVLSQLSRALKDRGSRVPQLTDLRESGDIEQDADVVILLHREGYYDRQADQKAARAYVAKNRDGDTGVLKYSWYPENNKFAEEATGDCPIY